MENRETIWFTISLLLLLISMSVSPLLPTQETTALPTLLCMILIASTTFLDTWSQQKHTLPVPIKKMHVGIAIVLGLFVISSHFWGNLTLAQYTVVAFLILSVVASMLITRQTQPMRQFAHTEKSNRIFALIFLTLTPVYLIYHYTFENTYPLFQMGFLLYFAFTALAGRKIYDDMQRLSLLKEDMVPNQQMFTNYALTNREQEIATLLHQGNTYQHIADQLFISLPTVKTHASNIYKKCGVKTRSELVHLLS